MCVIIHKPAGEGIPSQLLLAAASLNRDSWGLMGFDADGDVLLQRHQHLDTALLLSKVQEYRPFEFVLHLRQLTRGSSAFENVHPLEIGHGVHLMHNGTLPLESGNPGRSDSWHLVNDVLKPLVRRDAALLDEPGMHALLELALGANNRAALLNAATRRIHIFNRRAGVDIDGLWISNTRWIDQRLFVLPQAPHPQERSPSTRNLVFI